jgi:hypothetical protein
MIDTTRDMILAYIVATVVYVAYSISLAVRAKRLRRLVDSNGRDA